ncbi:MAG: hypothetical protein HC878_17780, partial [Leptolyngbyaceae cyanobacterium SL_5_14]|nr:hypothetical protein [Leptolyngbyaceae cyanobacterium SL_5_14]
MREAQRATFSSLLWNGHFARPNQAGKMPAPQEEVPRTLVAHRVKEQCGMTQQHGGTTQQHGGTTQQHEERP